MARYKRTRLLKYIDPGLATLPTYFLAVDMAAYIRDQTGDNMSIREVREVMLHKKRAQTTGVTVRRGGSEFAVLKKYGADDPPDNWTYNGGRKEA